MKKKESGTGAINYACFFVVITIVCVLHYALTYRANLYVAEEVLENGLHIAESATLAANQGGGSGTDLEKERKRMNIVPKVSLQGAWGSGEKSQVDEVGKKFAAYLKEQYNLANNVNPGNGILTEMCGADSEVLISGDVLIYEPCYTFVVSRTDKSGYEEESDPKYADKKYNFEVVYEVSGWVEYDLHYQKNSYTGCTKKVRSDVPVLKNGEEAEGATIEATVGVSMKGLKNIFAKNGDGIFAQEPEQSVYNVVVTQAVDIVIADRDSRRR